MNGGTAQSVKAPADPGLRVVGVHHKVTATQFTYPTGTSTA